MVAAAFAEAQRHALDVIWWIRCEDPATLMSDLAELAEHDGLTSGEGSDLPDVADQVRRWLEGTDRPWLVVFDNALSEASIESWRPKRGGGSVLVTSRNRNFDRVGQVLDVAVFDTDTSEQFLRDRVRDRNSIAAEEVEARTVAEQLDGLPLALEQAASWVSRAPTRRFSRYLKLLDDAAKDPYPDGTRPHGYAETALTTWRVSVEAAAAEIPISEHLMWALGYFAPDNLPLEYLATDDIAGQDYLGTTPDIVEDALVMLHRYSLIELSDSSLSVHRVVQDAARRSGDDAAADLAAHVLRAQAPGRSQPHPLARSPRSDPTRTPPCQPRRPAWIGWYR